MVSGVVSVTLGLPLNVCVAESNASHAGSEPPPESAAEYVSVSPASASAKVLAANVNDLVPAPVNVWFGIALATVGVSFTETSVIWKLVDTVPPWPSSAVTWIDNGVVSEELGLPLNVRVAELNDSHAGSEPPPERPA